nr:MAG TPA: hypothetical protein [Caudoviricetes sp.]
MKKNVVISSVAAVAAMSPEGFTVNAANLQPVTSGYAVALKRTQNSFGAEGLAKVANVIEELQASGNLSGRALAFGGWYDSESGLYYYDATVIFQDREEAIEAGRANEQIAIFDLANLEEIRL